MINFFYETDFKLENETKVSSWINSVIKSEDYELGEVSYIFCDDAYLHNLNVEFLNHDSLTDIISFDNSLGIQIFGEIYISVERVKENAKLFGVSFASEIHRVIIHGVLHYCGYKDKTDLEAKTMRSKEEEAMRLLNLA